MAYFHEKEFFPFFLRIKLNDSFFVYSTTDFFLIQISSIFGIRNRKLCHTVESWNIIYEEDSHRGESPRLLIKYFIVIIDSLTNTSSYVTTANGFKREDCKRI